MVTVERTVVPSGGPVLSTRLGIAKATGTIPRARREVAIIVNQKRLSVLVMVELEGVDGNGEKT